MDVDEIFRDRQVEIPDGLAFRSRTRSLSRCWQRGGFIFGIGVSGEFPPEFEACGVPVKQRGGRATETIQVNRRLWSEPTVEHHGRYFGFGP